MSSIKYEHVSSRRVGLQLTSIRQFQDLERQLQQARQQLAHFRSIMPQSDSGMDTDLGSPPYQAAEGQSVGSPPPKRKTTAILRDFSQVRADLRQHGRGLLQIPSPYQGAVPHSSKPLGMPDLPPKHVTDRLLLSYHENFHLQFPILHWPTFLSEYNQLCRTSSVGALGTAWGAVFLCVLACGTLYTLDPSEARDGKAFLTSAIEMSNLWQDDFSIQDARMAFLIGVFLMEHNLKSASWVWLGSAIRISQDIGLHVDSGPWCPIKREMRRRLWYCIYAWDRSVSIFRFLLFCSTDSNRILALELGKPLLINDADFDTEYPEPADDEQITSAGVYSTEQSTALLATVHVVRSFQSLCQLLKSPYITRYPLEAREEYLHNCFSLLPKTFQPSAAEPLDPRTIAPLICLQNARLSLQRHNLAPACPPELRLQAIDKCVMVARDTAMVLSRCLDPALSPKQASTERSRLLAISASTMLCMHIWRCLLLLLFRTDYHPAIVLVQAASAIGGARQVNLCCGRYVQFFLRVLYARVQQETPGDFDNDEELIAYASGDAQNNPENNWVWQGAESGTESSSFVGTAQALPSDQPRSGLQSPVLVDQEAGEWGGWEQVERSVHYLLEQQQQNQRQQTQQRSPQQQAPINSPSDTSRMTIANII
jgi:Fungal specific transcription factor domain